MGGHFVHVEHAQPMTRKDVLYSDEREIGEMLVINRVELHMLDQMEQVRKLDSEDP